MEPSGCATGKRVSLKFPNLLTDQRAGHRFHLDLEGHYLTRRRVATPPSARPLPFLPSRPPKVRPSARQVGIVPRGS